MKLFSCRGISGLQAKSFQKLSEGRGDPRSYLSTSPSVCPLQKYQAFCSCSFCTLEWVREGSHELFSWKMWGGGNPCVLEAEWKFLHMAQRMRVKGLRKLRVLSSLQAFALSLIGSVCFSALINNAAAIHSETQCCCCKWHYFRSLL